MRPTVGIIRGPTLYRHDCRTCAEETLHNARGCIRCGTSPWTTRIELSGYAGRVMRSPPRRVGARK